MTYVTSHCLKTMAAKSHRNLAKHIYKHVIFVHCTEPEKTTGLVHCTIPGPCLCMHHRPSARRVCRLCNHAQSHAGTCNPLLTIVCRLYLTTFMYCAMHASVLTAALSPAHFTFTTNACNTLISTEI